MVCHAFKLLSINKYYENIYCQCNFKHIYLGDNSMQLRRLKQLKFFNILVFSLPNFDI